jgi:hypothetical protein
MRRLLFLSIFVWLCFAAQADAAERVALIFGNGDYQNAPRLPNPLNDATDVAAAFERLGFSVQLIKNGTFDAMRRSLLNFAQQTPKADIVVVYFAGHGMEIRDENWLIPIDAELRTDFSAGQEAISLANVLSIASKARKLGLIILDACRDNPFGRQLQMSQPGRAVAPRGLLPVEPPNSVLVVFAAKHGTTADDGAGRNSPFTMALLHNLETPGLEINYLLRNIHDEVYASTGQHQEPYVYGTLSREPIYLKPADPGDASLEAAAARTWEAVKETNSSDVLKKFIERYGTTIQGELARERLALIGKDRNAPPLPDDRAQPTTVEAKPAQMTTAEPPKDAAAASSLPPQLAALAGHWSWQADCGLLKYSGTTETEVFPDGRYISRRSDDETIEGRISGNTVTGVHKVDGGVQRGTLNLTMSSNGRHRLVGSFTDSRLPSALGNCRYRAVKG